MARFLSALAATAAVTLATATPAYAYEIATYKLVKCTGVHHIGWCPAGCTAIFENHGEVSVCGPGIQP